MNLFQKSDQTGTSSPGCVTIAGAGPGDPELITVKTVSRIREAQCIVYDALISSEIRALFPPAAELYDVGKRAGNPFSCGQDVINELLARLFHAGRKVLRLKGGDPYIYGRGGEEALFLGCRGIPFEVIPAVSSINGAAASTGIPLTHRKVSRGFTVLMGQADLLDTIDWKSLVSLGETWVFLMAKETAADIAARLLGVGANPSLPMAVIENATLAEQRVTRKTLAEFERFGFVPLTDGPGILIAGPTVSLIEDLYDEEYTDVRTLPDLYEIGGKNGVNRRGW